MTTELPTDIETLMPHRAPMRIVERVAAVEEYKIETVSEVRESWPTCEGGRVMALTLIELIAQSASALQGWREHGALGAGRGLLVGVREALFRRASLPVGMRLHCFVQISHGVESYCAFDGRVLDESGEEIAVAAVQAYRP
jgi:predicted hotdog family 3-hydroxylacyl-ACP dehydratase